ncbi:glycerophosphoryl diester phosphodiesterase membrane domain-containing protein [Dermacoccaceae bacterium W4C1]
MSEDWTSPSGSGSAPEHNGPAQGPPGQYGAPAGQYGHPSPPQGQYGAGSGPPPGPQYGAPAGQYGAAPSPQYGQQYGPGPGQPGGPGQFSVNQVQPGIIPLRPLVLGDIFSGALRTIRGNPGATLGLSLLVAAIFALPAIGVTVYSEFAAAGSEDARDIAYLVSNYSAQLVSSFGAMVLSGMLVVVLAEAVLGRRISIGATWTRARGHLGWVILASLMVLLIALLPYILVFLLILVLLLTATSEVGIVFGVFFGLAASLAVVYLWVKLSFTVPIVVLERTRPITAIKRSWALTQHNWWRIFGISLLGYVLVGVISAVLYMVVGMVGVVATIDLDDTAAADSAALPLWLLIVTQVLSIFIAAFTSPFLAGVTGLQYLDQRMRKEGLDLALIEAARTSNNT